MIMNDKVVLVTGGASGIGESTVKKAAAEGAKVIITDVQVEAGQLLAEHVGGEFVQHDVSSSTDWDRVGRHVQQHYGRLDALVNNAGIFVPGSIEEVSEAQWNAILGVNLTGVMFGCQQAVRLMKENPDGPKGAIVNVSSIAGYIGLAGAAAYTASKGAVRLLSKSIAVHCAREYKNIRCNTVHPGAIDTPMNQSAFEATGAPAEVRSMFEALQPVGRLGTADEVADAVIYLASDQSAFVTGTELLVDGGWLANGGAL